LFLRNTGETPVVQKRHVAYASSRDLNEVSFSWHIRFAHRRQRGDFAFFARDQQHNPHYLLGDRQQSARAEQVKLFREWLKKNHYPDIDLRLDSANSDQTKKIIQGVSGVGSDVMDVHSAATCGCISRSDCWKTSPIPRLRLGFDPSKTYASILPEITLPDPKRAGGYRQYIFPCNVYPSMYIATARRCGRSDSLFRRSSGRWKNLNDWARRLWTPRIKMAKRGRIFMRTTSISTCFVERWRRRI